MINVTSKTQNTFAYFLSVFFQISVLIFSILSIHTQAQTQAQGELVLRKTPEAIITESLRKARPDINFGEVRPAVIKGLYQVQVSGGPLLFVTPDGKQLIAGEAFAIGENGLSKIEDPYIVAERKKALADLNKSNKSINFKPKGKTKSVVYVFTDIDCGYCRKLHREMAGYNDLGIEIRYLAYPRAGIPSPSADKLISAWCAKDKQAAINKLKNEESVPNTTCDNPVAQQFELGGKMGVNGTPALFLPSGELVPGYVEPAELAKKLGI
jgi:thiol:disulfide interchange protein DsbC